MRQLVTVMDNKSSRPPKTFKPSIAFSNPKKISAVKSFQCFPSSYSLKKLNTKSPSAHPPSYPPGPIRIS